MKSAMLLQIMVQNAQARAALKAVEGDVHRLRRSLNFDQVNRVGRNFRDLHRQAAAFRTVLSRTDGMSVGAFQRMAMGARIAVASLGTLGHAITGVGRDMQWLGRQIEFRISLPLAFAAGAAIKFALDNEKAFTRIRKVYGGATDSIGKFDDDLGRLRVAFRTLSDVFGVAQDEVIEVGAAWAQAGAQGKFLAEATRLTIQTAILGEIGLSEATKSLLTVQQAYQLNIKELTEAVAVLNMVENETTASFTDLVEVFGDAAGAAVLTGVSIEQLAAVTAALVPVGGNASEVGNALKSIFARIAAPTRQAENAFRALGVQIDSMAWASQGLTGKLFELSRGFGELTNAQQQQFVREVFQLRQFNRSALLIQDLLNKYSRYKSAIEATTSAQANATKFNEELMAFLRSSPQQLQIVTNRMKNLMADLGTELLPIFTQIVRTIEGAMQWFNGLSEGAKRLTLQIAAAVAILGPLMGILGAFIIVLGTLLSALGRVVVVLWQFVRLPWLAVKGVAFLAMTLFTLVQALLTPITLIARFAFLLGTVTVKAAIFAIKWVGIGLGTALGWLGVSLQHVAAAIWRVAGLLAAAFVSAFKLAAGAVLGLTKVLLDLAIIMLGAVLGAIGTLVRVLVGSLIHGGIRLFILFLGQLAFTAIPRVVVGLQALIIHGLWAAGVYATNFVNALRAATFGLGVLAAQGLASAVAGIAAMILTIGHGVVALGVWAKANIIAAGKVVASWLAVAGLFLLKIIAIVGLVTLVTAVIAEAFGTTIPGLFRMFFEWLKGLGEGIVNWIGGLIDGFRNLIDNIAEGIGALPGVFATALQAVINVVAKAIEIIWDLLSYLNPFASHSPSLVDQVSAGIDFIIGEYDRATVIADLFKRAARNLNAFMSASERARALMQQEQMAEQREVIAERAPEALGAFDAVSRDLVKMNQELGLLDAAIRQQESVVAQWASRLEDANRALDTAADRLREMRDEAAAMEQAIADSKARINELASTPLVGMGAAEDEMFGNDMRIKELRLELLKMEQATGPIEDVQDKLGRLAGDLELFRSRRTDLRLEGAGEDILGVLDNEIAQLETAQRAIMEGGGLSESEAAMQKIRDEIAALELENEIAQLEFDLEFGPQLRAIDQLVNAQEELSFDEIVAGIEAEQAAIAAIQPELDAINAEIEKQEALVDELTATRDKIQASYDAENEKLDNLKDAYRALADLIRDAEAAINEFVSASESAAASGAGDDLTDFGPAAEIPDVTGSGAGFGAAGFDQDALDDFIEETLGFDTLLPVDFQEKIDRFKEKFDEIKEKVIEVFNAIKKWAQETWPKVTAFIEEARTRISAAVQVIIEWTGRIVDKIIEWSNAVWNFLKPAIDGAVSFVLWFIESLQPLWDELAKWGPQVEDIWNIIKIVFGAVVAFIDWFIGELTTDGTLINEVWEVVKEFVKTAWEAIVTVITETLGIIRGIWDTFAGLFTGDWDRMWNGIKEVAESVWELIKLAWELLLDGLGLAWDLLVIALEAAWDLFWWQLEGTFKLVKDAISAAWDGLMSGIQTAWDGLKSGLESAMSWLEDTFQPVFEAVADAIGSVWDGVSGAWSAVWGGIESAITTAINGVIDVLNFFIRGINNLPWVDIGEIGKIGVGGGAGPREAFGSGRAIPFAASGMVLPASPVGSGFAVAGARAIVGEGSNMHPEYVIPTDPRHRSRALSLFSSLAASLGFQTPGFLLGGIISGVKNFGSKVLDVTTYPARLAAHTAIDGVAAGARALVDALPRFGYFGFPHDPASWLLETAVSWAKSLIPLAHGGLVTGGRGGIAALLGEGGNDELVMPLPSSFDANSIGHREIHFHGDLSFPNVKDGSDAKDFLENLEALVGRD